MQHYKNQFKNHNIKRFKKYLAIFISLIAFAWHPLNFASTQIGIFPLKNYDQNVDSWLKPSDPNYKKSVLDLKYQEDRFQDFYNHYFSTDNNSLSPWSKIHIEKILNLKNTNENVSQEQTENLKIEENFYTIQKKLIQKFSNDGKSGSEIGYGENYKPYNTHWIEKIANNMNVEQFKKHHYNLENRGIMVQNAYVRVLPTTDPHFYHFDIPGQGYPFDNLQMSDIWAGIPVYIIGATNDKQWLLIKSPDVIGWVQNESVGKVNEDFVKTWQKKSKQNLLAIIKTEAPIYYGENEKPLLSAYVGSFFPAVSNVKLTEEKMINKTHYKIHIPVRDIDGNAAITEGYIQKEYATPMPFAATPENFAKILKTLQNRLYGWGGLYFYNDCSQELKSFYTPFGIYLGRNSASQIEAGKSLNLSSKSQDERIKILMEQGRPMLTVIYLKGHVLMYMGNYPNPNSKNHELMPMTYQNMWSLRAKDQNRRSIVGQSVLIPLLKQYPEDPKLNSLANGKEFRVILLDQWPEDKL